MIFSSTLSNFRSKVWKFVNSALAKTGTLRNGDVLLFDCRLFLPRDAMQARPMPPRGVCLSARLSRFFVNSVKTSKHIFKIFAPSGSETILVFPYQYVIAIFRQVPPNWGVECRWGRHKWRFWTTSWLLIDEYNSARLTIGGRRCSSVSQLRCTSVYGTETATHH